MTSQDALIDATRVLGAMMEAHDARLQAELLLAHALEVSRATMLARLPEKISPEEAARYAADISRRAENEPLAYILGHQEFFGLNIFVDRRTLIPRHETETLVQLALERARDITSPLIVDVGTGSGAIALTLARQLPDARVFAIDQSRDALDVARLNAKRLTLESRIEFLQGDLLEPLVDSFDVLVANLPYIPTTRFDQLPREVREFEPRVALDGGADGLGVVRRLLAQMPERAKPNAIALLEISEEQGASVKEIARQIWPHAEILTHRDLEELDRVVELRWVAQGVASAN